MPEDDLQSRLRSSQIHEETQRRVHDGCYRRRHERGELTRCIILTHVETDRGEFTRGVSHSHRDRRVHEGCHTHDNTKRIIHEITKRQREESSQGRNTAQETFPDKSEPENLVSVFVHFQQHTHHRVISWLGILRIEVLR